MVRHRERTREILALLRARWPELFSVHTALATGIARAIQAELGEARLPAVALSRALHWWTNAPSYLVAVAAGRVRRNLDGTEAGVPDEVQHEATTETLRQHALRRAAAMPRSRPRSGPRAAPPPPERREEGESAAAALPPGRPARRLKRTRFTRSRRPSSPLDPVSARPCSKRSDAPPHAGMHAGVSGAVRLWPLRGEGGSEAKCHVAVDCEIDGVGVDCRTQPRDSTSARSQSLLQF